ncbi:TrmH family RNA methyltransferase [Robiginitalea sp. IMCC43444]|uniref:TrmH family RNA methyltransferase n=1 Tax=Robiginitalea sp. IMCC43444 TaxID=3459121 RepID=UPI004041F968
MYSPSDPKIQLLEYLEGFISPERSKRFEEILKKRTRYLTVALEDVFQMHNASAVVRSCDVFGLQEAHLIEKRFGQRLDKNIALGAQKWVDISRYTGPEACLEALKNRGFSIVATTPHGECFSPENIPLGRPLALFFGTEKEGLSQEILSCADMRLKIPMYGFSESLNISVAAAIIIQQLSSRLRASDIAWGLSEDDILEKRLDWTCKSINGVDQIIERYSKRA